MSLIHLDLMVTQNGLQSLLGHLTMDLHVVVGGTPAKEQQFAVVFGNDLIGNFGQIVVKSVNGLWSKDGANLIDERDGAF